MITAYNPVRFLAILLGLGWCMYLCANPVLATVPCTGFYGSATECPGEQVTATFGYACNGDCNAAPVTHIPMTAPADGQSTQQCTTYEVTCYDPCPETATIESCFTATGDASACEPDCSAEEQALQEAAAALEAAAHVISQREADVLRWQMILEAAQEAAEQARLELAGIDLEIQRLQDWETTTPEEEAEKAARLLSLYAMRPGYQAQYDWCLQQVASAEQGLAAAQAGLAAALAAYQAALDAVAAAAAALEACLAGGGG